MRIFLVLLNITFINSYVIKVERKSNKQVLKDAREKKIYNEIHIEEEKN